MSILPAGLTPCCLIRFPIRCAPLISQGQNPTAPHSCNDNFWNTGCATPIREAGLTDLRWYKVMTYFAVKHVHFHQAGMGNRPLGQFRRTLVKRKHIWVALMAQPAV